MTKKSRVWAVLAPLLFASCSPHFDEFDDFIQARYVEIYRPFFVRDRGEDGTAVYRAQRKGSAPASFAARKAQDAFRVFVVGGSVAQLLGVNDHLERELAAARPDRHIELVDCGMAGYDSYRDGLVAREVLRYQPDLLIVLSGNNEFYRPVKIDPALYRLQTALRRLPPFRQLRDILHEPAPGVPVTPAERLAQLETNLRGIAADARARAVPLVLCALPAAARVPPGGGAGWHDRGFAAGVAALDRGDARAARRLLADYSSRRPDDASGVYELARAEQAAGDKAAARRDYLRALDLQEQRCGAAKNEVIRRVARETGAALADLDAAFASRAPDGLIGPESLIDGVHWYQELDGFAGVEILRAARLPAPSPDEQFARASKEEKARRQVLFAMKTLLLSSGGRREDEALNALQAALALAVAPTERLLLSPAALDAERERVSTPLETTDRIHRARPLLLAHAGEAWRRLGRPERALELLDEALLLDPKLGWGLAWRGLAERALGRGEAARRDLAAARRLSGAPPELVLYLAADNPSAADSASASARRP